MKFKIDPDTKDALLFTVGLFGVVAQLGLYAVGVPASWPLIVAFLAMCGIAVVPNPFSPRPPDRPSSYDQEERPKRRRGDLDGDDDYAA